MMAAFSRLQGALFERILRLDKEIRAEAISQSQTQAPQLSCEGIRIEEVRAHVGISSDGEAASSEDLAKAQAAIKFADQIVQRFDRIIANVPPMAAGRVVIRVINVAAESPHMPVGQPKRNVALDQVCVEFSRRRRSE